MLAAALLGLALAAAPVIDEPAQKALIFRDGFNGNRLSDAWTIRGKTYETGSTHARGSRRAVSVSHGALHLRTIADPNQPGRYLNGHIGTEGAFTFAYGTAAARIRFAPFKGSHGAFWLLTPKAVTDLSGHEVDVAEHFGAHRPNRKRGVDVHHNVWRLPLVDGQPLIKTTATTNSAEFGARWHADWHTYKVRWTPTRYVFAIDGRRVHTIHVGLSSAPMFPVLSMLTRDWEVDDLRKHSLETYVMDVDWIKVWQKEAA